MKVKVQLIGTGTARSSTSPRVLHAKLKYLGHWTYVESRNGRNKKLCVSVDQEGSCEEDKIIASDFHKWMLVDETIPII